MDFDVDGLDIDAALFAEPEAQARRSLNDDLGKNPEGQAPTLLRSPIRPSAEDVEKHGATLCAVSELVSDLRCGSRKGRPPQAAGGGAPRKA